MGKRKKSTRKPAKAITRPLDTTFRCLFCQHQGTVTCKMDTKAGHGQLHCQDCGQKFMTPITHLTEPVDVYSEWIDACEAVNAEVESEEEDNVRNKRQRQDAASDEETDADQNKDEDEDAEYVLDTGNEDAEGEIDVPGEDDDVPKSEDED